MTRMTSVHRLITVAVIITMMGLFGVRATNTAAKTVHRAPQAIPVLTTGTNVGDGDFVKTLDPALPTDSVSYYDIQLYQANLVKFSYPSLTIVPDLATWTVSKNRMVYTFHIRPNARFNNGDAVTAADAAWSMDRALKPATKSPVAALYLAPIAGSDKVAAGKAQHMAGVTVVDRLTLRIRLTAPYAYFLGSLTYPTADVLDARVMKGKTTTYLTNHCAGDVGAGPFQFVCANNGFGPTSYYPAGHSPYFLFSPNPFFYGAKPHVDLKAPFAATIDQGFNLLRAGVIDDLVGIPTADIGIASHMKGFAYKPAFVTDYITPNRDLPPFNNINCRLAVAYAIDRVGITKKLLKGTELPLFDVLPPGFSPAGGGLAYFGFEQDVPYYSPAKAQQYLNACPGKLSGVSMTFQNTSSDIAHEMDIIRADLAAIGANITLVPLTFNKWLDVVGQSMNVTKTQITENLWIDDYPDAQDWLSQLLQSGANYDIGDFKNPTYDELVNRGNVAASAAQRGSLYRRAMKIAINDGAWISVGYGHPAAVVRPKQHNLLFVNANVYPLNGDWSTVSVS